MAALLATGVGADASAQSSVPPSPVTSAASPWAPLIHQNLGGTNTGQNLMWADQNIDLVGPDYITLLSPDQRVSIATKITGVPAPGETPGIQFVLAGITYNVTYQVQATDDTIQKIANGIGACMSPTNGNGKQWPPRHCSPDAASFRAAMDKYGYAGLWQVITGDTLFYNAPSVFMSAITPLSSAHVTVQILNQPETASLDNGPFVSAGFVSQRTPHPGDLISWFRMDGQSNATNFDTQYAGIKGAIGSAGPAPGRHFTAGDGQRHG
jgi:hypothetical protein